MRIGADGAPAHLSQSLAEEMTAAGVPDSVDVFASFEAPWAIKGVAADGVKDYWFFVKSEGNPAVIKKAETDDERHAAARAVGNARAAKSDDAVETPEAKQFDDEHPGTAEVDTPDLEGGDHPKWHLQRSAAPPERSPMDALKSLTARLESLIPRVERMHPLQKEFLISKGYPADEVNSASVPWTPDLARKYQKWLASSVRSQATRLLGSR